MQMRESMLKAIEKEAEEHVEKKEPIELIDNEISKCEGIQSKIEKILKRIELMEKKFLTEEETQNLKKEKIEQKEFLSKTKESIENLRNEKEELMKAKLKDVFQILGIMEIVITAKDQKMMEILGLGQASQEHSSGSGTGGSGSR